MRKTFTASTVGPAEAVLAVVSDLSTYPDWLDVVYQVEGEAPSWTVTLRAAVGPLSRSKRLRMVRTVNDLDADPAVVRFERVELDGRDHAAWDMEVSVDGGDATVTLSYDGSMWTGPLDLILDAAARRAAERLAQLVETGVETG